MTRFRLYGAALAALLAALFSAIIYLVALALPRVRAADNVPSAADGNSALLVIDRIGGELDSPRADSVGQIFGLFYDNQEEAVSVECCGPRSQFRSTLSGAFPRIVPRFPVFVPAGRTGWELAQVEKFVTRDVHPTLK